MLPNCRREFWTDPVHSKVIATAILCACLFIVPALTPFALPSAAVWGLRTIPVAWLAFVLWRSRLPLVMNFDKILGMAVNTSGPDPEISIQSFQIRARSRLRRPISKLRGSVISAKTGKSYSLHVWTGSDLRPPSSLAAIAARGDVTLSAKISGNAISAHGDPGLDTDVFLAQVAPLIFEVEFEGKIFRRIFSEKYLSKVIELFRRQSRLSESHEHVQLT